MNQTNETIEILQQLNQLYIFRSLKEKPLIRDLYTISETGQPGGTSISGWFGQLMESYPETQNPWTAYLWNAITTDENAFALICEHNPNQVPENIKTLVYADLQTLQKIVQWQPIPQIGLAPSARNIPGADLLIGNNISACYDWLVDTYSHQGTGVFTTYNAFIWESSRKTLRPIPAPDPIQLTDLVGCEDQKALLVQNTRQFLQGLPSNNILLYGDRGTGKSSSVKALGNLFANAGLRIIEIAKEDLADFPEIVEILRPRGLKFILFVDDLSFETNELQYKHLKAVLEGGLEVRPANVVIYATSNRRHLITESFTERSDEVNGNDTVQEKLSLADRFGITLTYTSPNQNEYLAIVQAIAAQRSITIPADALQTKAIRWELNHNGRSGRTAKQFIDQLEGELRLQANT